MDSSINSIIQGIQWPALPGAQSATRLATLFQLEQSQWWSESKLKEHQFKQLKALLDYSISQSPYYKNLLGKSFIKEKLTNEQWLSIPLLTRDTLQKEFDNIKTKSAPPSHGKVFKSRTSGSTGKPVDTLNTDITNFFWNIFTLRDHLLHKRDLNAKLAVIRHTTNTKATPPHGLRSDNWGQATNGLMQTGESTWINIHTPISQQIEWLLDERPDYLLTHPSVLQELALTCRRKSINFPFLKEVRTISEALPDGIRELCESVWNVPLVDIYSTIELGYLALQCPDNKHYHVQSEGVYLEVLDDNNQPCSPGQIGKVVVTNLHNFATPLIRYEVGDYAEVGEQCCCGRGLPVLKRILGRTRNLIQLPTGEKHWPKFSISQILQIAPVKQYQAIQHTVNELEYKLVSERELSSTEKDQLETLFKNMLHPDFKITITEVNEIPRNENGKYEEFISLL